ncbi:MAG: polymer-forming cytoskeletal protein [Minisyncoccia bacterium]
MKKLSLFLVLLVAAVFGVNSALAIDLGSYSNISIPTVTVPDVTSTVKVPTTTVDTSAMVKTATDKITAPSKVDANGNLTLRPTEVYNADVNLSNGTFTANPACGVVGNVVVNNGDVKFLGDVYIKGSLTVNGGNFTASGNVKVSGNIKVSGKVEIQGNAAIEGSVTAGTLSLGPNSYIVGPVFVTSENSTITVGPNGQLRNTLTSKSGIVAMSNAYVKLFLNGDTIEIDGVPYKLGGKIISTGPLAKVGLPYVPKPKASSTVEVIKNTSVAPTEIDKTDYTSGTDDDRGAAVQKQINSMEGIAGEASKSTVDADGKITTSIGQVNSLAQHINKVVSDLGGINKIISIDDVKSYVSEVSSIDENIGETELSDEEVSLDYDVPASLFGFIPASLSTSVNVSKDKNVDVKYPWYSFLFSTPASEADLEADITETVNTLSTSSTEALSAKLQVSILNSVLSIFGGLFNK